MTSTSPTPPRHQRRAHPRRRSAGDNTIAGLGARRAALRLLDAVLRRGEPLEIALHAATQGLEDRADKALAHAIAADVLRWMADLDALIDSATPQILPEDAKARMVLRMALVQVIRLETPPHAAIATALPLMDGGPRRLVHGVLGTLLRAEASLPETPTLPEHIVARWSAQWGEEMTQAVARALARRAPIDVTLADPNETAHFDDVLAGDTLMPGHVRISHAISVPGLPGYKEGRWWVQDLAASLPARLAGAGAGRSAIDLCAAPGGKTMQLAAQGWAVTAIDKSAKRLERMADNMKRSGLSAQVAQGDALTWEPENSVDLILLDAPCSATGIFRRHPDVLYRAGERMIGEMAEQQSLLLNRCAPWVKPGGMLIYATCSLEQSEGEEQIERFLASHPDYRVESPREGELPASIPTNAQGCIRTLPGMLEEQGGVDGFFIARLIRK
ncbi:MAG: methyltransferase domain-containing protein [Sphingobium sp.]|nr:methyltransferase domain-containing protein [Sphingobium sp.]